ncbi:MAG: methyltransferase domain-containing protein [Acidobacteria bacterium]|nr:methyltransferase domain-containing protein [Acidobacteriota bacterium]
MTCKNIFDVLKQINHRPRPFEFYTADSLWTDEHISKQMLQFHLDKSVDMASRNHPFIDRSVDWICSHFNLGAETSVVDFGCGPGLYTSRLAKSGTAVTGIDFSGNSITYARETAEKEGLKVNYVQANYLDFETADRYDLITMIMCDFCALSPEQRAKMLRKFRSLLKPGGAVLLDVYSLVRFAGLEESFDYDFNRFDGFWSPDDSYCFMNSFKYENEKVGLDKYTIIEKDRIRVVYNWLQHFDADSLMRELLDAGFTEVELYKNVAGDEFEEGHTEFAVIAR